MTPVDVELETSGTHRSTVAFTVVGTGYGGRLKAASKDAMKAGVLRKPSTSAKASPGKTPRSKSLGIKPRVLAASLLVAPESTLSLDSRTDSEANVRSVDRPTRMRLESELEATLKRRLPHEGVIGGAFRLLWDSSVSLRRTGREAFALLLRRRSFDRPLFGALVRALAEDSRPSSRDLLREAVADEEAALCGALAAACVSSDAALGPLLDQRARSPKAFVVFAAECARVLRGETSGARLGSLAPRIKEESRLLLIRDIFVPLARRLVPQQPEIGSGLFVLSQAERHLGRWLALGEVATAAGSDLFRNRARDLARTGPESSRGAWSLVEWVLARRAGETPLLPPARLQAETLSRLSDRPSADRDWTFLFRLESEERNVHARGALEKLATASVDDAAKIRALRALSLGGHVESRTQLRALAEGEGPSDVRGLATAALWDAGDHEHARECAAALVVAKELPAVIWGSLVRLAEQGQSVVNESRVRWIERGECEA